MSEFGGIIHTDDRPVSEADVQRLTRTLEGVGKARTWRSGDSVVLAERRGPANYDNGWNLPLIQREPDKLILATARLDAPRQVKEALNLPGHDLPDDRTLVAAACVRWGPVTAANRLYGDFAIAEWDERARRLTLARDALGARPLYYVVQPGVILFATTLQTLLALPQTPRDLDEVVIAHTLTIAMQDQEQTIYRHIRRVPPGGSTIYADGSVRTDRHFTLASIAPVRFARDDDYVEAGRELLDRAVAARLSTTGVNGATLSGGFDSAGVVSTAARLLGNERLQAFTRAPGADHPYQEFDEKRLAGLVAARYGNIDWHVVDDDRESPYDMEPEQLAGALLVPRQSSFNNTWFESLQLTAQAKGVDVMLNGGSGNSVLSWHGGPEVSERVRSLQFAGLARDVRHLARERGLSTARTAASLAYYTWAPRSLQKRIYAWRDGGHAWPWLSHSLVAPDFLTEIDYGAHSAAVGHDLPFRPPYSGRELRLRMLQGQRGRDMSAYTRRRWRARPRDPYNDRALVEFALGIPEDQYWRDGVGRWLARRVLADRVPPEILAERRKGKQSPEWYHTASRRREAMASAIDRISRSRLASRVLDIPRMRGLLDQWPKDAEDARKHETLHGHALLRAIAMGGFLRWHEGGNE